MITVKIDKPLFDNYVYIRDMYIRKALRTRQMLHIVIPQGDAVVTPWEWLDGAKKIKKVFKIPGHPMTLYGNFVPLDKKPVKSSHQMKIV